MPCYSRTRLQAWNGHTVQKKKKYFPFWISVLHELILEDYTLRYNYCDWLFNKSGYNWNDDYYIFSDKMWFHLSGYVNSQNYWIWSTNNLHVFEETLLHPIKVGIWCAISTHQVVSPIVFDKTMDSDVYMKIIQDFVAFLEEDERYAWFQQDGATAHTAEKTMDILAKFFKNRIITKGRW